MKQRLIINSVMKSAMVTPDEIGYLRYPLYASTKYNGIRAYFDDQGILRSKSNKLIPNAYIRSRLHPYSHLPLDGELIAGETYEETKSNVMTDFAVCKFKFYVFDWISGDIYNERFETLMKNLYGETDNCIQVAPIYPTADKTDVMRLFEVFSKSPYPQGEGIVLRDPLGLYKQGRSTVKEQFALKMKDVDVETALVVGIEPLIASGVQKEAVGSLTCALPDGRLFSVGTGFSDEQRVSLYNRPRLVGSHIKYSYLPACSKNGLPSQAVFVEVLENGDDES